MQRYGAPYGGGWMEWPLKWLKPVETALNVYNALTAVNDATSRLEGDALVKWNERNKRTLQACLSIHAIREELENGDNGG
jgi:hypothetical protein